MFLLGTTTVQILLRKTTNRTTTERNHYGTSMFASPFTLAALSPSDNRHRFVLIVPPLLADLVNYFCVPHLYLRLYLSFRPHLAHRDYTRAYCSQACGQAVLFQRFEPPRFRSNSWSPLRDS